MHNISNLFYFGTTLYMFQMVSLSIIRSLRLYIYLMLYVVLDSWWWTKRPSQTCRVFFQNKIHLRYCAYGWFYYRNILWCTVLQTSNKIPWQFITGNTTLQLQSIWITGFFFWDYFSSEFLETAPTKPPSKTICPPLHKDHVHKWAKRSSTDASNVI